MSIELPWIGYSEARKPYSEIIENRTKLKVLPIYNADNALNTLLDRSYPILIAEYAIPALNPSTLKGTGIEITEHERISSWLIDELYSFDRETPIIIVHQGLEIQEQADRITAGKLELVDLSKISEIERMIDMVDESVFNYMA